MSLYVNWWQTWQPRDNLDWLTTGMFEQNTCNNIYLMGEGREWAERNRGERRDGENGGKGWGKRGERGGEWRGKGRRKGIGRGKGMGGKRGWMKERDRREGWKRGMEERDGREGWKRGMEERDGRLGWKRGMEERDGRWSTCFLGFTYLILDLHLLSNWYSYTLYRAISYLTILCDHHTKFVYSSFTIPTSILTKIPMTILYRYVIMSAVIHIYYVLITCVMYAIHS